MKVGEAGWREARDDMGRTVWVNLSLARTIRRDPAGRCTWVSFDKEHTVAVQESAEQLLGGGKTASAMRPHNFDNLSTHARSRAGR